MTFLPRFWFEPYLRVTTKSQPPETIADVFDPATVRSCGPAACHFVWSSCPTSALSTSLCTLPALIGPVHCRRAARSRRSYTGRTTAAAEVNDVVRARPCARTTLRMTMPLVMAKEGCRVRHRGRPAAMAYRPQWSTCAATICTCHTCGSTDSKLSAHRVAQHGTQSCSTAQLLTGTHQPNWITDV